MPETARQERADAAARAALNLKGRLDEILDDLAHNRPVRCRALMGAMDVDRQLDGIADLDEILARQQRAATAA